MKASGDHEDEFDETEVEISTETETMENQEKRKKFLLSQINSIQPSDLNFRYARYYIFSYYMHVK